MKAIILAAGRGTRLGELTRDRPKGLLEFQGQPLIAWQLAALREAGIGDISIVTGYRGDLICFEGVTNYANEAWAETNMVESLLCARPALSGDVLVVYADLLYSPARVRKTLQGPGEVRVAADSAWRPLWEERYGTTETDLESFDVDDGLITDLGRPLRSSAELQHRYVGLVRFSAVAVEWVLDLYARRQAAGARWTRSGNPFPKAYMTDLLGALIDDGHPVHAATDQGGWWEFDTVRDYEVALQLLKQNELSRFVDTKAIGT